MAEAPKPKNPPKKNSLIGTAQELKELEKELVADVKANIKAQDAEAIRQAKKAKLATSGPPLVIRLMDYWTSFRKSVSEIFLSFKSPDRATRYVSLLFFASLFGVGWIIFITAEHYARQRARELRQALSENDQARHLNEFFKKQSEEAKQKTSTVTIGSFTIELKDLPNQKNIPGVMNMAEIEMVLECDGKDTRVFVEKNLDLVRNQVTSLLFAMDREELMSKEGKRRLKKIIQERLNGWLPSGRIEDLYFSRLVVS